jgi:hypothetical protein
LTVITGSDTFFTSIDGEFTATKWEACIDQAIDKINGYARDDILPNLSGTVGSKSVTVTSGQAGFIRDLAVAIYAKDYKNNGLKSTTTGVGQINTSGSVDEIESLAEKAASFIKELDVSYG